MLVFLQFFLFSSAYAMKVVIKKFAEDGAYLPEPKHLLSFELEDEDFTGTMLKVLVAEIEPNARLSLFLETGVPLLDQQTLIDSPTSDGTLTINLHVTHPEPPLAALSSADCTCEPLVVIDVQDIFKKREFARLAQEHMACQIAATSNEEKAKFDFRSSIGELSEKYELFYARFVAKISDEVRKAVRSRELVILVEFVIDPSFLAVHRLFEIEETGYDPSPDDFDTDLRITHELRGYIRKLRVTKTANCGANEVLRVMRQAKPRCFRIIGQFHMACVAATAAGLCERGHRVVIPKESCRDPLTYSDLLLIQAPALTSSSSDHNSSSAPMGGQVLTDSNITHPQLPVGQTPGLSSLIQGISTMLSLTNGIQTVIAGQVPGDGSCFFHSIAQLSHGTVGRAEFIQRVVSKYREILRRLTSGQLLGAQDLHIYNLILQLIQAVPGGTTHSINDWASYYSNPLPDSTNYAMVGHTELLLVAELFNISITISHLTLHSGQLAFQQAQVFSPLSSTGTIPSFQVANVPFALPETVSLSDLSGIVHASALHFIPLQVVETISPTASAAYSLASNTPSSTTTTPPLLAIAQVPIAAISTALTATTAIQRLTTFSTGSTQIAPLRVKPLE